MLDSRYEPRILQTFVCSILDSNPRFNVPKSLRYDIFCHTLKSNDILNCDIFHVINFFCQNIYSGVKCQKPFVYWYVSVIYMHALQYWQNNVAVLALYRVSFSCDVLNYCLYSYNTGTFTIYTT